MDAKEAIKIAKEHVSELFADEGANDIRLEEVENNDAKGEWRVTVSFDRRKNLPDPFQKLKLNLTFSERLFRAVCIEEATGKVKSVTQA